MKKQIRFHQHPLRILLCFLLIAQAFCSSAQETPLPELSVGVRTAFGQLDYDQHAYTAEGAVHTGPNMRYQLPVKLFTIRDKDMYINLVGGVGISHVFTQPQATHYNPETYGLEDVKTPALNYVPLTFGIYLPGTFGLGMEASYWKGIGVKDVFSMKVLSLMLNIKQFKIGGAYEIASPLPLINNPSQLLSFELYYILPHNRY